MLLPEPVPVPARLLPPEVEPPVALDDGDVEPLDDELGDAERRNWASSRTRLRRSMCRDDCSHKRRRPRP